MSAVQQIAPVDDADRAPVPTVQSESAAMFSMIERAARDPNVDIDKLERLMAMQERMTARKAEGAYASALAEMQPELPVIDERGGIKDKNQNVQSTYAKWADINEAIRPVLAKHGFALSFLCGREEGQIIVTGVLRHREGHTERTTIHLPLDTSGSKNNVQAVGSSTSYGQRYTARALLNLTSRLAEDRDDDGHAAGVGNLITDDQAIEIRELNDSVGSNLKRFLATLKVDRLSDLPAARFDEAIKRLNRFRETRDA